VQTTNPRVGAVRDAVLSGLDSSGALRWISDNAKPLPTYGAGAFVRKPHPIPFRRDVGSLFPQPDRLDADLGSGWAAVCSSDLAAAAFNDAGIRVVERPDDAWLAAHATDFALLRPDRYVFACEDVPSALAALRQTVGSGLRTAPEPEAVAA
jgi:hypothetical protein